MNEQRFIDIESKLTHQELLTEDLHKVIYEQQKTIDQLEAKLKLLIQRQKETAANDREIGPANEKPPHY